MHLKKNKAGIGESTILPHQKKGQALKNLKIKELKHQKQQFLHIMSIVYGRDKKINLENLKLIF